YHQSPTSNIIDSIEDLLDYNPNNFDGYRMIATTAEKAKMYILAEFSINEIPEDARTQEDLLTLARSLLEQKKFDKSLKIANSILEKSPENADAKDIVWKSSVDKQINQNVDLVVADGIKQVAPPKVDASQIVMSNAKAEDENSGTTGNAKQKK
ncbi:MAG: hypothetical protein K2L13_02250, partial [Opitutales bacterium]|nr:hypothetical protein [Opitutales bacterium]